MAVMCADTGTMMKYCKLITQPDPILRGKCGARPQQINVVDSSRGLGEKSPIPLTHVSSFTNVRCRSIVSKT